MRVGVLLVLFLAGCGGVKPNVDPARDTSMDGILRLVGRFSAAHACPISESIALTSAHVIAIKPFDKDFPLLPYRYSTLEDDFGFVGDGVAEDSSDLAAVRGSHAFKRWYPLANEPPKQGDRLRYMAYDHSKRGRMFRERIRSGTVDYVVAGHIVMSIGGPRGSSGSCVLNDNNEVVGVNSWALGLSSLEEPVGVAVGVWGNWIR